MPAPLRDVFGIPLPPGFEVRWDPDVFEVRCEWCGRRHLYTTAGYTLHNVQADALRHRVECHTPDAAHP